MTALQTPSAPPDGGVRGAEQVARLRPPPDVRDRRRLAGRYVLGAVLAVALVVAIGPRGQSGVPLDPRSTAAVGTRGIVEVLERLGTDVRVDGGAPVAGEDGVALVISDLLAEGQRQDLRDWVDDGGRLVLADPFSDLAPDLIGLTNIAFTEPTIEPACDDPLVAGVDRVAVAGGSVFELPEDATGCFPRNEGFWMVRSPSGAGEIIVLGGPFTLTNELLATEDTAVLLVNLLTPGEGAGLHVVLGDDPEGAPDTLSELLPDQVAYALLQIPIAWLALLWWRGRRHGQPVVEATPVRVEAAETTVAVGNLLHRAGRAADAAAIIRARVHGELSRRLGIPWVEDPQTFLAVVASRTELSPDVLHRLLLAPLPTDDTGLVRFAGAAAAALANIRQRRSADPSGGSTAVAPPAAPPPAAPAQPPAHHVPRTPSGPGAGPHRSPSQ